MDSFRQQERVQYFSDLFQLHADLFDHRQIPEIRAKGTSRAMAVLPLKNHLLYGETILNIQEKYNSSGEIEVYRYAWELSDSKGKQKRSKQSRHITSFDKQPHPDPPRYVKTDPFHHHHVPNDPVQRTETRVQNLEEVVFILRKYIEDNREFFAIDVLVD